MKWQNSNNRYGLLSISLHWLMLLLLVAVYACMELREFYPKGSDPREALKTWHFMLGLSVFALVFLRLTVRIGAPQPEIVPAPPHWQLRAARLMHLGLYLLMIAMPLLGWLTLSAAGKTIPFFFGIELPALLGKDKELAELIKEVHETGAAIGYALIGLHTIAALYHHYFVRDNTLQRMLPGNQ